MLYKPIITGATLLSVAADGCILVSNNPVAYIFGDKYPLIQLGNTGGKTYSPIIV